MRRRPLARRGLAGCAVLLAALTVDAPAAADGAPALPERWLAWNERRVPNPQALAECDAGKALAAEWEQNQQRLAAALARSGGALPAGVFGELQGTLGSSLQDGQPCRGRPLMGDVRVGFWPASDITATPGAPPRLHREHGHHFVLTVRVNTFAGVGADRVPDFLRGPGPWTGIGMLEHASQVAGFALLNRSALVVTPPGRGPAYVPLPLEQALKRWLPAQAQALKEQEALVQQYPAAQREALRQRAVVPNQALLARGQALQRQGDAVLRGPAHLRLDRETGAFEVVAQPGADTSALVQPNPAYFDPRLPRSALQLLVIEVDGLRLDQPLVRNGEAFDSATLTREWLERVDWKALARSELR